MRAMSRLRKAGIAILVLNVFVTEANEDHLEFILHPGSGTRAVLHFSKEGKCMAILRRE